jgi:hypothetical protein
MTTYDFGECSEDANRFLAENYIKESTIESLNRWVCFGTPCGDFLQAVLLDKLTEAVGRADEVNQRTLPAIVSFIYNCLPSNCHGNKENMASWRAHRGLLNRRDNR